MRKWRRKNDVLSRDEHKAAQNPKIMTKITWVVDRELRSIQSYLNDSAMTLHMVFGGMGMVGHVSCVCGKYAGTDQLQS